MLSLFNNGELPLKRINGMELYRFGDKIGTLWKINKTDRYKDVHMACMDARIALENLIERSDYLHIVDRCKEPAKLLIKALSSITGARDKDKQIDIAIYHNLRRRLQDFEPQYEGDIEKGLMFIGTPKGTHDIRMLIEQGECEFPEKLKSLCPEAIPDLREGTKCLVYEAYTASAFHFHRANETVVLKYMKHVGAVLGKNDDKNLSNYIRALKHTKKVPDKLAIALYNSRDDRNDIMHPEIYVYDFEKANTLFLNVKVTITGMVREMT